MKLYLAFIVLVLSSLTLRAGDKPVPQLISDVRLDLGRDGKSDLVAAVLVGATDKAARRDDGSYWLKGGESVDIYFYMDNGGRKLDLSVPPTFVKKDIFETNNADGTDRAWAVFPLVQKGEASVALHSCYGCGASISWDETLTIVSRNQQLLVAGFSRSWDENIHLNNNSEVATTTGRCDINFLSGKGLATSDITIQPKPLKQKFRAVKLADWSVKNIPEGCD